MTASKLLRLITRRKERGAALVIVLAFVVLLTGLVVAYFSRSINDRQLSNSSFNEAKVDAFARSAADVIVADLKQEIVNGSTAIYPSPSPASGTIYTPTLVANMLPQTSGTPGVGATPIPNLIRRSLRSDPLNGSPGVGSRASAIDSSVASSNGRSISLARWNKHYLIPRLNTGTTIDSTPVSSFIAPDWVVVTAEKGPDVLTTPIADSGGTTVTPIGRYAYAIYDEGGLLDVNAAGYPAPSTPSQYGYKLALAYADLTQLPTGTSSFMPQPQVDNIVGWRNYASVQATDSFGSFTSFSSTTAANYFNLIASTTNGFLKASLNTWNNRTDQSFLSRQELLNYRSSTGFSQNALQYLGTFSRALEQPSSVAAVQTDATAPVVLAANLGGNSAVGGDKLINPSFPYTRVLTSFTRTDPYGATSTANPGDPLVNKRFPLQRLAWITYKGASATRTQTDADIQALINNGIPWSYLQLGTTANIQKYFGLNWDALNRRWKYNVHVGGSAPNKFIMLVGRPPSVPTPDATKYVQDANREPDFFELLKAGISVGSLGKAAASSATSVVGSPARPIGYSDAQVPVNMRYPIDSSVDYHVIQIGANILSEVNPTSYPVRITFDDGTGARPSWEFQGVTDLPYLGYVFNGVLRKQAPVPAHASGGGQTADDSPFQYPFPVNGALTTPGNAYLIQVPAVWNPYDPNGTSAVLRPSQFRIIVDTNDPVSMSNGSADLTIWHGAKATNSATYLGGDNSGLINANAFSMGSAGLGGTTEIPGTNGTKVNDGVTFNDGNGTLYREPTVIFSTSAPGNATRVNAMVGPTAGNVSPVPGDVTSLDANPLPGSTYPVGTTFAPLILGQFPLAFEKDATHTLTYYTGAGLIGPAPSSSTTENRVYFMYRLQYPDPITNPSGTPGGAWVTYDTKYGRTAYGVTSFQSNYNQAGALFSPSVIIPPNLGFNPISWAAAIDPRSARFGLSMDTMNTQRSKLQWESTIGSAAFPLSSWIFDSGGSSTTVGITSPIRPEHGRGFYFANLDINNLPPGGRTAANLFALLSFGGFGNSTRDIPYPSWSAGWTGAVTATNEGHGQSDVWMFAPGMYAQNNPGTPFYDGNGGISEPSYYADADGVVRRAAGAYVPADTTNKISATSPVGLPPASIYGYSGKPATLITPATATPFTQSQSRPLLLHRPFRTVAELGYVFRDLPWKNLDFFTPESADAALLDIFCINETSDPNGLIAGKVNLNTRQTPVLAAIVSGAYVDDPKISDATVGKISPTLTSAIASALVARTTDPTYGPVRNLSELVGKWGVAVAASGPAYSPTNSTNNWGIDLKLASGYKDGRMSYTGFSGGTTVASPAKDLTSVFGVVANFDGTASVKASLSASVGQVQRFHEAPIRALASVGQTRVWNLMIDVVAQTGRYPSSATTAADLPKFVVEGEQRYWVHVAIDRLTGQVIDKQIEVVKE